MDVSILVCKGVVGAFRNSPFFGKGICIEFVFKKCVIKGWDLAKMSTFCKKQNYKKEQICIVFGHFMFKNRCFLHKKAVNH